MNITKPITTPAALPPQFLPQQGQFVYVWILFCNHAGQQSIDHVYTHKVQAESDLRKLKAMYPDDRFWLLERRTEPHDNHR